MLIWSGHGYLCIVIYILVPFLYDWLIDFIAIKDVQLYLQQFESYIIIFISGLLLLFVGNYLNSRSEMIIHRFILTGDSYVGKRHTLFYIPMEYWGIGSIFISILSIINELFIT